MAKNNDLQNLVQGFVTQLVSVVEAQAAQRMQASLANVLGGAVVRRRGRPPKNAFPTFTMPLFTSTKPRPKQFCPIPGCKNVAAPAFGMVCSKHKDVPKAKVKKYREARRAAKAKTGS